MVSPYLRRRLRSLDEIASDAKEASGPVAETVSPRRRALGASQPVHPRPVHVAESENAERRAAAASPTVGGR